jgi:hypothetical protein
MQPFSAVYVPPDGFLDRAWYLPVRPGVPWFYHAPRLSRPPPTPAVLDATLDPPLIALVAWARSHGLTTGPSCAGHTVTPGAAAVVWRGLVADAAAVRGEGLVLADAETGARWLWRARDYRLPYPSAEALDRDLHAHERAGLLPLSGPAAALGRARRAARCVPWASADVAGPWLRLRVRAPSEAAQRAAWGALAAELGAG